jgi:hypothetical protein
MVGDDDIERLLREVDALEGGRGQQQSGVPAKQQGKQVQTAGGDPGGSGGSRRLAWVALSGAGGAVTGFVIGALLTILPWVSSMSTAVGAALGAALVALISGPPRWFEGKD